MVAGIVTDTQVLDDVVENVRAGGDDGIHIPPADKLDDALLHSGRDHGAG